MKLLRLLLNDNEGERSEKLKNYPKKAGILALEGKKKAKIEKKTNKMGKKEDRKGEKRFGE